MTSYEGNESDEDQSSSGRPAKYHNPISGDSDASDVLDIDDLSEEHNAGDDAMDSEGVDGGEGDSISNASNSNLSNIPDIASDIIEPSDAEPEEDIQAREEEKNDSGDELGHEKLTALEPIRLKLNAAAGIKEWKEKMDPFDEDESDHLIPEDFFTVCKAIGFKLESQLSTKSAINQIFDAFDSKKSGLLQISAFLDWLASDPVQAVTAETHKQTSKINFPTHREKFGEQVQLIKQRMKAAAMGPGGADWQLLFHHVDSDHSKTISFEEFRRAIRTKAKLTEKKFPHEHLELVYNAIDTDNDQRITSEEFKTWFSNSDSKADFSEKKAPRVPREFEARERPLSFDKNQPIGTHTAPHRSINEISERIKTAAQTKGVGSNFKLLWKRVSINGHESLNLIEFKCAMRDLGVRYPAVSDIDLEALFKHIDVNESNMVDAEEFQQFLNAGIVAQPKHKTKAKDEVKSDAARIQEGILMVRQQFKAAAYSLGGVNWPKFFQDSDTNRNNSLSYEEFRHLIRTKGKITEKKLGDQSLLHIFDLIDLDKNNSITIHEFLEWFEDPSEHAEPGPLTMSNLRTARKAEFKAAADENHLIFEKLKQKLKAAAYSVGGVNWPNLFQNADLDNSGYISLEEFTHLLRTKAQLTDKIFPSESIVKLFNSIDFNEDGIIGVSEFLQYFEDASQDQVATPVVTFKAIQQVDAKQNTDENVTALVTNIGANHSVPLVSTPRHSTGPKPSFVGTTSSQFQQPKTNSSIKSSVSAPSFSQPSAQETQKQPTESLSETETKVDPQFHDQLRQKLKSATFTVAGPNWIKLFSGDSSASLTLEEFRVILRTDGKITEKLFSNDLIRSVFHAVDVNSTSKIEMSDFVAWFSDELSKKAGQRRRNQPIILSGKRGQFDRSGHGFVTGAEDEVNASNSSVSNKEGGPVVSSAPAPVQVETKVATSDIAKKTPTSKAISVESASTFRSSKGWQELWQGLEQEANTNSKTTTKAAKVASKGITTPRDSPGMHTPKRHSYSGPSAGYGARARTPVRTPSSRTATPREMPDPVGFRTPAGEPRTPRARTPGSATPNTNRSRTPARATAPSAWTEVKDVPPTSVSRPQTPSRSQNFPAGVLPNPRLATNQKEMLSRTQKLVDQLLFGDLDTLMECFVRSLAMKPEVATEMSNKRITFLALAKEHNLQDRMGFMTSEADEKQACINKLREQLNQYRDKTLKLQATLDGQTKKSRRDLMEVQRQLENSQKQVTGVRRSLALSQTSVEESELRVQKLQKRVKVLENAIDTESAAQENVQKLEVEKKVLAEQLEKVEVQLKDFKNVRMVADLAKKSHAKTEMAIKERISEVMKENENLVEEVQAYEVSQKKLLQEMAMHREKYELLMRNPKKNPLLIEAQAEVESLRAEKAKYTEDLSQLEEKARELERHVNMKDEHISATEQKLMSKEEHVKQLSKAKEVEVSKINQILQQTDKTWNLKVAAAHAKAKVQQEKLNLKIKELTDELASAAVRHEQELMIQRTSATAHEKSMAELFHQESDALRHQMFLVEQSSKIMQKKVEELQCEVGKQVAAHNDLQSRLTSSEETNLALREERTTLQQTIAELKRATENPAPQPSNELETNIEQLQKEMNEQELAVKRSSDRCAELESQVSHLTHQKKLMHRQIRSLSLKAECYDHLSQRLESDIAGRDTDDEVATQTTGEFNSKLLKCNQDLAEENSKAETKAFELEHQVVEFKRKIKLAEQEKAKAIIKRDELIKANAKLDAIVHEATSKHKEAMQVNEKLLNEVSELLKTNKRRGKVIKELEDEKAQILSRRAQQLAQSEAVVEYKDKASQLQKQMSEKDILLERYQQSTEQLLVKHKAEVKKIQDDHQATTNQTTLAATQQARSSMEALEREKASLMDAKLALEALLAQKQNELDEERNKSEAARKEYEQNVKDAEDHGNSQSHSVLTLQKEKRELEQKLRAYSPGMLTSDSKQILEDRDNVNSSLQKKIRDSDSRIETILHAMEALNLEKQELIQKLAERDSSLEETLQKLNEQTALSESQKYSIYVLEMRLKAKLVPDSPMRKPKTDFAAETPVKKLALTSSEQEARASPPTRSPWTARPNSRPNSPPRNLSPMKLSDVNSSLTSSPVYNVPRVSARDSQSKQSAMKRFPVSAIKQVKDVGKDSTTAMNRSFSS